MLLNVLVGSSSFLALFLFALWAVQGVGRPADARIRTLATARQRGEGLASIPFQERVLAPFIEAIGRRVAALLPQAMIKRSEQRLIVAGKTMAPTTYYALMLGAAALMAGTYYLLIIASYQGTPPVMMLLPGIFLGLLGAYFLIFWLSSQARTRQAPMLTRLPHSVDLLT